MSGIGGGAAPARLVTADEPVTADEVDKMFRAASVNGPWPDIDTCGHVARVLESFIQHPCTLEGRYFACAISQPPPPASEVKRRLDAMNKLRAAIAESRISLTGDWGWEFSASVYQREATALANLETALNAAEGLLCGQPPGGRRPAGHRPWYVAGFTIADLALAIFTQDCGSRARTVSRNTVAAKFTELALERIGFKVGREEIAQHWAKWNAIDHSGARRQIPPCGPEN